MDIVVSVLTIIFWVVFILFLFITMKSIIKSKGISDYIVFCV